jgi:hypothetical protein
MLILLGKLGNIRNFHPDLSQLSGNYAITGQGPNGKDQFELALYTKTMEVVQLKYPHNTIGCHYIMEYLGPPPPSGGVHKIFS